MYQNNNQSWKEMTYDSMSDVLFSKCELYEGTLQTVSIMLNKLKEQVSIFNHGPVLDKYIEDILQVIDCAETGSLVIRKEQ